ncbi:MAG: acyl-CoA thioesterase [Acidimicrobiales bacterium]
MRALFDPPTDPAAYPFTHRLRARFADTDAMGLVHHAAYLPWMEEARVEWLRALGHPYDDLRRQGIEFPVVEVAVRYRRPFHFDDLADLHLVAASVAGATFQIGYLLACGGEVRATAITLHGVVEVGGRPVRAPQWLRELATGP